MNAPMSIERYLLIVAKAVAARSTCRRQVGCVLADSRGRILATGYNGPPSGVMHCAARGCCKETSCSGKETAGCTCSTIEGHCDAIHAEVNAVLQCKDPDAVYYAAVTRSPCVECTKVLMNTGARRIMFEEASTYPQAREYWLSRNVPGKEDYYRWYYIPE